ncbi:MAG: hypothetical protein LKG79_03900 [Furfurilactobacillus sp.]|uniref:Uncharacterized protein n=1 Tax=Furfurilactobacillus milii TaxID=2888272 RepID=A0ABT6DA09_9LACO|nr:MULTISPECIES: hypothetical protein [Furfurilactobacillus]QLE67257.1 hypothetical protein LROSL2_1907 [Furfurilactobacillus rossiae]MCF6161053.1 hypothetical protein [Furfurilactobacillus milii]MCF6163457.1 hypothetical protein [Furfurilactobacillus milii]MCF6418741.1 hypothetical protein [Furfurilactobacillus milii]MCH4011447.1 hypothetical protein [Furfurilactobacillus sp.]
MPKHSRLWYQIRNARHAGEGELPGDKWRTTNAYILATAYYQTLMKLSKTELAAFIDVYPEMIPTIVDGHAVNVDGAYLSMDEWQALATVLEQKARASQLPLYQKI